MMMAVNPPRFFPVEAAKFVALRGHNVLEAPGESRVENSLSQPAPPQVFGDPLLRLDQAPADRSKPSPWVLGDE